MPKKQEHDKTNIRRVEVLTYEDTQSDLEVIGNELALTDSASIYRAAVRYFANRLRRTQDTE